MIPVTYAEIEANIRGYNEARGRRAYLEAQIALKRRELEHLLANLAVYEAGPAAQIITGMPHGTKLSDPTAETAMRLAEGPEPPEVKALRAEIARLEDQKAAADAEVCLVDAMLIALTEPERYVITHQLINGQYWAQVVDEWESESGQPSTKAILKRLKSKALEKLQRVCR